MEGTSISPSIDRGGAMGAEERHPPASSKIIFERTGTQCQPLRWRSNAGWSAPQPPTPHPSGDRPWPFGRRGLLLCSPSMDWGKPKRSRNRRWSTRLKGLVRPSFGLPSAPDWRTSPFLADESAPVLFRSRSQACELAAGEANTARRRRADSAATHNEVVPVDHSRATAKSQDRKDLG
jgi:hypothetical protein